MQRIRLLIAALLIVGSTAAHATVINTPSAPVTISGFNQILDVLVGADIAANGAGRSISMSGFDHEINISGGILQGGISFSGFDHVFNITGGSFGGDFLGSGFDHIFNFTGFDLVLNNRHLTGFLLDGSAIDINIQGGFVNPVFNITNVSVPEPGSLALLGIGLFGIGLARRRKKV